MQTNPLIKNLIYSVSGEGIRMHYKVADVWSDDIRLTWAELMPMLCEIGCIYRAENGKMYNKCIVRVDGYGVASKEFTVHRVVTRRNIKITEEDCYRLATMLEDKRVEWATGIKRKCSEIVAEVWSKVEALGRDRKVYC